MKTLVIFYSLEGNTRFISEIVAKELQADIIELKTVKSFPSTGIKKFVWGGKSVVLKERPELKNKNIDLSDYENIIIGTPIWAGTYAAPFNTFFKQYKFSGKKVAFFACHAGGGTEKCFKMFKKSLPDNTFVGEIDFIDPLKKDKKENNSKAINWAKSLTFD
ncbi:NAD(P)H-dependent oxidoreductase [Sedimentibacter sp. zth1]|uniref:flavodoxin family protein n=1 Tax=Sedimentibacter sp. zth1 TaxID=2816908 RepID=UPI001A92D573|nr:flavodoxin [Sedimentibacter sp. zth1]QSX05596.1 NAD(P)H-dependent oxidoreductase [Sedimentibacter sp. zth1]